jgi:hypothetical protein
MPWKGASHSSVEKHVASLFIASLHKQIGGERSYIDMMNDADLSGRGMLLLS